MTQEEKQLLLVDLCSRLPYGVICKFTDTFDGCEVNNTLHLEDINELFCHKLDCKPYLRPLSSMTEEEKDIYSYLQSEAFVGTNEKLFSNIIDWLNAHYFDYRGLIPKGLAISTEEFNPYKD